MIYNWDIFHGRYSTLNIKKNLLSLIGIGFYFIFAALSPNQLTAEIIGFPDFAFALDLPEGYMLVEKDKNTRFHLSHSIVPADLQIAVYPATQFDSSIQALHHVTTQLSSTGGEITFEWRFNSASIGEIISEKIQGWALVLKLTENKGWLALLSYTGKEHYLNVEPLLISSLDAVFTDQGSWFSPGPMTTFAWPNEGEMEVKYTDARRKFSIPMDKAAGLAGQSVIDREFSVLTAYLNTPFVTEAWKRYYRIIWRDSWSRLEKAGFIISSSLPDTAEKITAEILEWTQSFTYERDRQGSDFLSLPLALVEKKGDCDTRALLMVLLLNQMGIDAILMVSPEYGHAVAAVDIPGQGARFNSGGKNYLIADTTAPVPVGLIDSEISDSSKWFSVHFYAYPEK